MRFHIGVEDMERGQAWTETVEGNTQEEAEKFVISRLGSMERIYRVDPAPVQVGTADADSGIMGDMPDSDK